MPRSRSLGCAAAITALLIWSAWFAVTRLSVTHELRAADIVILRVGVGSLVLLPFFLGEFWRMPKRAWAEAIILSLCWGAPFVLLLALGIQLTSAAHAAALTPSTMPVFAGVLAWIFLGVRPAPRQLAGYAVIVAGVVALTFGAGKGDDTRHEAVGDLALLGAALGWAIYTVRLRGSGLTTIQAAFLVCFYSTVGYLPIYLLGGFARVGDASWSELALQIVYQGVLVGGLSVVAYNVAIAQLGPNAAAVVASLVPVVAALLAFPILGDVPTSVEAVAIAVISVGVLLAAAAVRRRDPGVSVRSSAAGASR
jgi:drug/metabolite transporter (DMT)-like permease